MWNWYKEDGAVTHQSYPYTSGITGRTGTCNSPSDPDSKVDIVSRVGKARTESAMIDMIAERPLTAYFAIDPDTFAFYSFGMITSSNGAGCLDLEANGLRKNFTNHQMAIVGYDSIG